MGLKEPGLRGSLRNTSSVLPAFFDVTITNTNSPVQEGDILTVDYSADNTGETQDMQDIRLEIDSVQEDVDPDVMLAGGASTTGTLEWDTTGEPEAEYTATVLSDDDSDSVMVEIGTAIPDNAVLRYSISEGSGTTVEDSIGENDLDLIDAPTWVSNNWQDDWALDFDDNEAKSNQKVDAINENEAFTVAFTVEPQDETSTQLWFEQLDEDNTGFTVGWDDDGIFVRDWDNNGASGSLPDNGSKYRVHAGYDGNEPFLYIDLNERTGTNIGSNGSNTDALYFGRRDDGDNPANAIFDDFIVYDKELSETERQEDAELQPWWEDDSGN